MLLHDLARKVRSLRKQRRWSRERLARESGVSVRFLARIESGEGNISVLRLEALARSLGTTPEELVRRSTSSPRIISLVGLRGAGKSTVGPLLAGRIGLPFVEIDELIVAESGLPLDQLFEIHGESYYRRLEQQVLGRLVGQSDPAVLAAAGGVVNDPSTWRLLCERTTVVWLRADAADHWNRVVDQGDRRPMADNPAAMQELTELLAAREREYSRAGIIADTTDRSPEQIAGWIDAQLTEP